MIKNFLFNVIKILRSAIGFSLVELVVSLAIFSMILLVLVSSLLSMNASNSKTFADREASESAERIMKEITYEVRSAKGIYAPTTTATQLSLETSKHLPDGQNSTFIDFFLCGDAVCFKKEFQDPIAMTPDSVRVTNLAFSQISAEAYSSVQINLTVNYSNSGASSSASLTSTASPRSY